MGLLSDLRELLCNLFCPLLMTLLAMASISCQESFLGWADLTNRRAIFSKL